jgi:hypothetical protein
MNWILMIMNPLEKRIYTIRDGSEDPGNQGINWNLN